MRGGRALLPLFLLAAALGGCANQLGPLAEQAVPPGEAPLLGNLTPQAPATFAPWHLAATECSAIVWAHLEEFGVMQPLLPPGFWPADFAELLKLSEVPSDGARIGQGAFGVAVVQCGPDDNGTAFLAPLVVVKPPQLVEGPPPAWLDAYAVATWWHLPSHAHELASRGWNASAGLDVDLTVSLDEQLPNPAGLSRVPDLRRMGANGSFASVPAFTAEGTATFRYHTRDPSGGPADSIRLWHDTPFGLSYLDARVSQHGSSGMGGCGYAAEALRAIFQRDGCGTRTVSLLMTAFDVDVQVHTLAEVAL